MNIKKLKDQHKENVKWIDDYQKVVKTIEDLQRKIKSLEELKMEIVESNTEEVINNFGHYDRLPYFYINLRDYAKDFSPTIYLNTKSVFDKKSSYIYFKEKLEEYVGKKLTLIEVVTPIFREKLDRDLDTEYYTTVHHLLLTDEKIEELDKRLKYMSIKGYKEFLMNEGVFVIKDGSTYNTYRENPSYQKLNELEQQYCLKLNNYNNREKHFLLNPITQKYNQKVDDILLDVFDYSVKLEKLKMIADEKETTEKLIKEHEELIKKKASLKKEIDKINELIR